VLGNEYGVLYTKLIGIEFPEYKTGPPLIKMSFGDYEKLVHPNIIKH